MSPRAHDPDRTVPGVIPAAKRWGIEARVLMLALLPAAVTAVLLTTYFGVAQIHDLERALTERGNSLVRQLAHAAEYGVFTGNADILRPVVATAVGPADVRSLTINDARGEILLHVGPPPNAAENLATAARAIVSARSANSLSQVFRAPVVQTELVLDDTLESDMGVVSTAHADSAESKSPLGWVTVELSRKQTTARQEQVLLSSILIVILCLVSSVALAHRMSQRVTGPILQLTDAVKRVGQGDMNVQVETHAGGELATLENGINSMTRALKASRVNLQALGITV